MQCENISTRLLLKYLRTIFDDWCIYLEWEE